MIGWSFLCVAYLMGSIPTGLIAGRLKGIDVRKQGSGNVGATNVYRVAGKLPGALVLIVDILKGVLPVTLLAKWGVAMGIGGASADFFRILLGCAAVAGHIWNPLLQFNGGKGVATGVGVLFGLDFRVGLAALLIWIGVMFFTRFVSVSSIAAAFFTPFVMALLGLPTSWVLGSIFVSLAIIYRHRPNILRLLQGQEHRFGAPKERPSL
jgi:glycerol-3-phosphate acyltransferase PlsY